MTVELVVKQGDVTEVGADVLLLKYAASFHGADEVVATRLMREGVCRPNDITPKDGDFAIVDTEWSIAPERVLFVGTPRLGDFRYRQIREFAGRAIEAIAQLQRPIRTLTTTVHGPGYGLDIEESLQAMVTGFQNGLAKTGYTELKRITFVEYNPRRYEVISSALEGVQMIAPTTITPSASNPAREASATLGTPAPVAEPVQKKCVFVAMPFQEDFEDVYQFGIYSAVRACGYVCEKVDESIFAGNIVDRIMDGIRGAEFVVADLTHEKPNVYLEVGFAWGLQRPVILVAREGERLHFDLSHHKCIFYKTIGKLSKELEQTIRDIFGTGERQGERGA